MPNSDIDTIIDYWRHQDRQRLTRENFQPSESNAGGSDPDAASDPDSEHADEDSTRSRTETERRRPSVANDHAASSSPTGNGPNANRLTKRLLQRAGRSSVPPAP